ncbi:uncharacterized protein PITG_05746 [Phytophthora infestans T30-4]|uniref:Uncharacterized protein n=2 Tax=Phytophthora infestans TaxID=4787 RepID=D0N5L0_PHYIT|nr:uncharacterized protein PITG_05746 [Phytophthora infestans T30-4]EEY70351.1 conserved hypothetical protein [Phytophthora infestans T30-4]KAF4044735.1 hypothetical protein GN244_ATG02962 [Phytophthora infestans]KAF4140102.1 hypothetical protein GN958_ATG10711 [Phytophthora infestans]|eukprot:XP_002998005.1 conserved hypothetical protein [Phytophthora infestans T30-4]
MQQNPATVEAGTVHPVTYRMTSGCNPSSQAHRNLSVSCAKEDFRRRRMSWNGVTANRVSDDSFDCPQRPRTTRAASTVTSPTRLRLIYEDEDTKARVCGNVQRLLNVAQKDPEAKSANAQLARKVLKYRRVMGRLDDVNVEDPDFDVSAFFGIEWCRVGAPSS